MATPTVEWTDHLKSDHITAACEYLSLQFKPEKVHEAKEKFEKHQKDLVAFKAKDLLRASGLTLLPETDAEVADHLNNVKSGKPLHPVALASDKERLFVADGFHRVCACYHLGDDTEVKGVHIFI